ncbi:MAG: NHL domain-containing thioredoxin family protein [Actinomycetota bacterium]
MTHRRARVRAPELSGRGWLNTGGAPLTLASLRGRFVLLDFWTFCCVNCLHVLDELRPLEEELSDVLVVVGVHSPKFAHEADPDALAAAVERYEVHHPVLDDPELVTWKAYGARAWPTLVLVDPEGYVVAHLSGEGHAHGLRTLLHELVAEHEARGTLHRGDGPYVPPPPAGTALRFPGKVVTLPGGGFLASDTAHHQLVELDDDLQSERRRIGCGTKGLVDGPATEAAFSEPQGLAVLPPDVAAGVGYDVVVADSVNHALRGVRLEDGAVVTVAGTGEQLRRREGGGPAAAQALSTPWDVAWFDGQVVVAMAGVHQLWGFDPVTATVQVLAGTTAEGLQDGPAEQAWFAQTSGLAATPDGRRLWLADSETSALRWLERASGGYEVRTAVGTGLFDFGFRDGPAADALLQHPLGVAVLPDGSVAVADTYNGAVRRYDPATGTVGTLARDLAEPSDLVVEADGATLVVVESAAHRLVRIAVPAHAQQVAGEAQRTARPATDLAPGAVRLRVTFTPPTGQKLDDRWGDPTRLMVSASPPELLRSGSGAAQGLSRELELEASVAEGVLHVSVQAAACDGDPVTGEVPEHAACHLYQQDWGVPVRLVDGADDELVLDLRGV